MYHHGINYFGNNGNNGNSDPEQLRRDLDVERSAREHAEQRARELEQAAERTRQEWQKASQTYFDQANRSASTWPEALQKQAVLLAREEHLDDETNRYFGTGKNACVLALKIWSEEEPKIAGQIVELQKQIAELRDGLRMRVADRLDAEMPENEHIAHELRTIPEEPTALSHWLDW